MKPILTLLLLFLSFSSIAQPTEPYPPSYYHHLTFTGGNYVMGTVYATTPVQIYVAPHTVYLEDTHLQLNNARLLIEGDLWGAGEITLLTPNSSICVTGKLKRKNHITQNSPDIFDCSWDWEVYGEDNTLSLLDQAKALRKHYIQNQVLFVPEVQYIKLISMAGQEVLRGEGNNLNINTLSSGVYIAIVTKGNLTTSFKFSKY